MNEISQTSLQPTRLRAAVVPGQDIPAQHISSQSHGAAKSGQSGNNSPAVAMAQARMDSAKAASSLSSKQLNESIKAAVAQINEYTESLQRNIQFNTDETSGRTVITVVDRQTQKVIRQIPNEVALDLARNLKQSMQQMAKEQSAGEFRLLSIKA